MNKPNYIVVHTSASGTKDKVVDVSRDFIDKLHKEQNGWKMIGYHYVIRMNGDIEIGRKENETGAHAKGLNSNSIGICVSGHGDFKVFTKEQMTTLVNKIIELQNKYNIPNENIIGHRELNDLVKAGKLNAQYKVNKTCPGKLIDMDYIRQTVKENKN